MLGTNQPDYWNEPQDDITIIFLDSEEKEAELSSINQIERELNYNLQ